MLLKYPVLVVLHQKHQLIEMRFDVLKQYFQTQQGFYSKLVQKIRAYLKEKLAVELVPLEMNFMKETANDEVKLIAEYMNMASGGRAVLEVGDNEEWVLPFIGELKSLIQEYHADLEKVPALEDALNQFVYEKVKCPNSRGLNCYGRTKSRQDPCGPNSLSTMATTGLV